MKLMTTGPAPSRTTGAAIIAVGQKLYVYGGNDASGAVISEFWSLDLRSLSGAPEDHIHP